MGAESLNEKSYEVNIEKRKNGLYEVGAVTERFVDACLKITNLDHSIKSCMDLNWILLLINIFKNKFAFDIFNIARPLVVMMSLLWNFCVRTCVFIYLTINIILSTLFIVFVD